MECSPCIILLSVQLLVCVGSLLDISLMSVCVRMCLCQHVYQVECVLDIFVVV